MKNKQAKRLLVSASLKVSDNGEVWWINQIRVNGDGTSMAFFECLGNLDCVTMLANLKEKEGVFNFEKREF